MSIPWNSCLKRYVISWYIEMVMNQRCIWKTGLSGRWGYLELGLWTFIRYIYISVSRFLAWKPSSDILISMSTTNHSTNYLIHLQQGTCHKSNAIFILIYFMLKYRISDQISWLTYHIDSMIRSRALSGRQVYLGKKVYLEDGSIWQTGLSGRWVYLEDRAVLAHDHS